MRSKNTAMKLACILGSFAFLMAIVAYAAVTFSAYSGGSPNGGFGPPIIATFDWSWSVNNQFAYPISGTADPDHCKFKKDGLFDSTKFSYNPPPFTNSSIPAGSVWSDRFDVNCNVMVSGNKYFWKWDSWKVKAAGSSGTGSKGKGSKYNCF